MKKLPFIREECVQFVRACGMAQQVKHLPFMPAHWSSIPESTQMWKQRIDSTSCSLTSTCMP